MCDGLLSSISALNLFSVAAFALLVTIRFVAPERSYTEACLVTYALVSLDLLLKLSDAALPVALTVTCFPESAQPPFNSTIVAYNCVRPCAIGDLYAVYFFYCLAKTSIGCADIVVSLPFLLRKPKEWYTKHNRF